MMFERVAAARPGEVSPSCSACDGHGMWARRSGSVVVYLCGRCFRVLFGLPAVVRCRGAAAAVRAERERNGAVTVEYACEACGCLHQDEWCHDYPVGTLRSWEAWCDACGANTRHVLKTVNGHEVRR